MPISKLLPYSVFLFMLISGSLTAQPAGTAFTSRKTLEMPQWEVRDIRFTVKKNPAGNPFDLEFGAVFTGPDKVRMRIPGFYNGNNEWVIRFSAGKPGNWSYETYASHAELSGLRGTVRATPNTNPDRHGMVMVDPRSPQNFVYEDGTPYFSLAFELDWLFALDYANTRDIPRTRQVIRDVKENGFNQIVMNVYAYDVNWKTAADVPAEYEYRRPGYSPFRGTNEKPDFSGLNVDFFRNFDRVIQYLDEQGIIAHVMIYVWNKNVKWPDMNSRADNMYYDYVLARYQAYPNIIWDVSKEALDYGRADIPYITERIRRIRQQDAYQRLLTVHDYEYCSREPDQVDFISIQSWRSNLYSLMLEARTRHSDKPVMNIEHGGYEEGPYISFVGNYTNPETCLIRNYECVFAGVYSSYYWQNTSWNIVIYDALDKKHAFSPPRYEYYKHLNTLFSRYDYNTLFPTVPKLTTNDKGGLNNLATGGYPLTNGKDLFLFLIPDASDRIYTVLPKPRSGQMEATWFNPFTGEFMEKGKMPWSGWQEFKSPWQNTYSVLIVKLLE
jgi:hypothetical protein